MDEQLAAQIASTQLAKLRRARETAQIARESARFDGASWYVLVVDSSLQLIRFRR